MPHPRCGAFRYQPQWRGRRAGFCGICAREDHDHTSSLHCGPAGIYGGVSSGIGVEINAPGADVFLGGLTFDNQTPNPGPYPGGTGITIVAANSVTIERCDIKKYFFGIYASGVSTQLIVERSTLSRYESGIVLQDGPTGILRDVHFDGRKSQASVVVLQNLGTGSTSAYVDDSVLIGGARGLSVGAALAGGEAKMTVTRSRIVGAKFGVESYSLASGAVSSAIIDHSRIAESGAAGLTGLGPNSTVLIDQDEVTGNAIGAQVLESATIGTLANNAFLNNGTDVVGGTLSSMTGAIK